MKDGKVYDRQFELQFTEAVLGTASGNKRIYTDFIAAKYEGEPGPQQPRDEIEALPDVDEELTKGTTFFWRSKEGKPGVFNYWIKGALKAGVEAMLSSDDVTKEQMKRWRLTRYSYKRTIGSLVFIKPRFIEFDLPEGTGELDFCERPLRAETLKGARTCLARSEVVPAGARLRFTIAVRAMYLWEPIEWVLDYGSDFGMGQWANSGFGTYTWKEAD